LRRVAGVECGARSEFRLRFRWQLRWLGRRLLGCEIVLRDEALDERVE
jgi:hypothetical protein